LLNIKICNIIHLYKKYCKIINNVNNAKGNKNEIINLLPKIINYDVTETFGWPYRVAGFEGKAWYGIPITLENNVSELHKQLFNEENYIPSDTVKQISQDIINDTGYDMSILDE